MGKYVYKYLIDTELKETEIPEHLMETSHDNEYSLLDLELEIEFSKIKAENQINFSGIHSAKPILLYFESSNT